MNEIFKVLYLEKTLDVEPRSVEFVKSKVATYALVRATLLSMPSMKQIQDLCKQYLCRAKIILNYKKATITFYDEPAED